MLTSAEIAKGQPMGRLDALLRFAPAVSDLHEAQTSRSRATSARFSIAIGLLLYNIHNITDFFLIPDIATYAVAFRLLVVTPVSVAIWWAVLHVDHRTRERLLFAGVLFAFALPLVLFLLSAAPTAAYTVNELILVLIFASMLLQLRYRHALGLVLIGMSLTLGALAAKPELPAGLALALAVQVACGCAFTLFANWRMERTRCRAYLDALRGRLRSQEANASLRRYEDLSLTDALTGLPNRRALDRVLDRCFDLDRPVALMMLDIDHFKLFNDRLGHPAGDRCLRTIAGALSELAERSDAFVARFGGEEFTIVVSDIDEFEAARRAERIVRRIEALGIDHPSRRDGPTVVTGSIGLAWIPSGRTFRLQDALAAADDALYAAKRRGRNGWVFAPAIPTFTERAISA